MPDTMQTADWTAANQAYLVSEFARLKRLLGLDLGAEPDCPTAVMQESLDEPPAIDCLASLLDLSPFERDLLLLCAGVEMDAQLAAQCGAATGRAQAACATFGLALAVLPQPHWSALTPMRPLRRFHLVELGAGQGLTTAPVRIDERILHYLAGINLLDPRLQTLMQFKPYSDWIAEEQRDIAAQAQRALNDSGGSACVVQLFGDDPQGQEDVAALVARSGGLHLCILSAESLQLGGHDLDQLASLWEREALLLPGVLLVQCGTEGLPSQARQLVERLRCPILMASREVLSFNRVFLRLEVNKPQPAEQKRLWQQVLGPKGASCNGTLDHISGHFRLSARTIRSTGVLAAPAEGDVEPNALWKACRVLSRPRLDDLAERIIPAGQWDDLVLPELQQQTLRQLAAQVRNRMQVYENWGFAAKGRRGLGLSVLFTGESGTGKTLAAEVLACDLGLDLYRIDLSAVVSKYIGETEKNLKRVFDAAEEGGAILLFDEADALFGKRSEVKDSHDRYANIEVGYLLQRMEAYQSLAILTTNLKSALDRSFQRRLRFTVAFPFPDAAQREAIWARVFPANTPSAGLSTAKLAQLNVAGGTIRNIALNAAFIAADSGRPVEMVHVLAAARLEAQKLERTLSETEIRGWV
jgi:hypothetical protein